MFVLAVGFLLVFCLFEFFVCFCWLVGFGLGLFVVVGLGVFSVCFGFFVKMPFLRTTPCAGSCKLPDRSLFQQRVNCCLAPGLQLSVPGIPCGRCAPGLPLWRAAGSVVLGLRDSTEWAQAVTARACPDFRRLPPAWAGSRGWKPVESCQPSPCVCV